MDRILTIKKLKTFFYGREGIAKAINGMDLYLGKGEILGLVGESGCGKSVTCLSILRLIPHPGKIEAGEILLEDTDLLRMPIKQMRQIRGDRISMIFQEPMISLNPAYTIGDQMVEALRLHRRLSRTDARNRAIEFLRMVDMPDPEKRMKDYPHQLSGGMRQRVMIAEALLLKPQVLLADEPTTALDVTIQAQILDIMYRLVKEMNTSIILITHNLGLVAESANRVAVMYAGNVVEEGQVEEIFNQPAHPYTQGLLRATPILGHRRGSRRDPLYEIKGIVPSLFDLPRGCAFSPRCPQSKNICFHEEPSWGEIGANHRAACWLLM